MEQEILYKECKRCHKIKPLTEFSPKKKMKLGVHSFCKGCIREKCRKYKEKNLSRDEVKCPEQKVCNTCNEMLSQDNFTKYNGNIDGLTHTCKNCNSKKSKIYLNLKKSRVSIIEPSSKLCLSCKKELSNQSFHKNKGRIDGLAFYCKSCMKQKASKYKTSKKTMERYYSDPLFRLKFTLRRGVKDCLIRRYRPERSLDLIGCTAKECLEHLESLLWPGMTWENRGKNGWHIDHIVPIDSFDITIKEEQYKCFNYKNLQPLWEDDNCSKGDRLDWTPAESKHPLPERFSHFATKVQNQPDVQQPPQLEGLPH
jgi:hypothetical protein